MTQPLLLLISFFLIQPGTIAQVVEGRIQNKTTKENLAYVNIGVVGKNVGTVSDQQGRFRLTIDERYDQDTLKISMVGYQPRTFTVADFKQRVQSNATITLTEAVATLKEVVVEDKRYRGRKLKERIIGNTDAGPNNQTLFAANQLGNEMGILIKIHRNPTIVQNFSIYITENKYQTFPFRLNFYSVENGLPHKNLLNENIIVNFSKQEGQATVDLREYNIVLEDDTIVTMEWIKDLGKHGLAFASESGSRSPNISRQTSQGNWQETGKAAFNVGIGITLTVLQ